MDACCPFLEPTVAKTDALCPFRCYCPVVATAEQPKRKDAARNRQRILAAATELFAERGLSVTLHDIAARAGVGVGTIYRHFPTKEPLIDAVFERELEGLTEL